MVAEAELQARVEGDVRRDLADDELASEHQLVRPAAEPDARSVAGLNLSWAQAGAASARSQPMSASRSIISSTSMG